jgi:hypothetical protein
MASGEYGIWVDNQILVNFISPFNNEILWLTIQERISLHPELAMPNALQICD